MVYDASWWEVFDIAESVLSFVISIELNGTDRDGGGGSETLELRPSSPRGRSANGVAGASLVGDLLPYSAHPVLSSQYLLMPGAHPVQLLAPGRLVNGWRTRRRWEGRDEAASRSCRRLAL